MEEEKTIAQCVTFLVDFQQMGDSPASGCISHEEQTDLTLGLTRLLSHATAQPSAACGIRDILSFPPGIDLMTTTKEVGTHLNAGIYLERYQRTGHGGQANTVTFIISAHLLLLIIKVLAAEGGDCILELGVLVQNPRQELSPVVSI